MIYHTQSSTQTLDSTRFHTRFLLFIVQTLGAFREISKLERPSRQGKHSSLTKPNAVGAQRQLPGAFQFAPATRLAGRIFVILTRGSRQGRALARARPFPRRRIHISCISASTTRRAIISGHASQCHATNSTRCHSSEENRPGKLVASRAV